MPRFLRAAPPLASTRDGTVHRSPALDGHPEREKVEAHEAIHVAQQRAGSAGVGPLADRGALEREAQEGSAALQAGAPFAPRLAAPPAMTLGYCPPNTCCIDEDASADAFDPDAATCPATETTPAEPVPDAFELEAHPDALSGVQPYLLVELGNLPSGRVLLDHLFERGPYLLAPHTEGTPPRLLYAIAYRKEREQNEWVIGAESLEAFAANVELYAGAANRLYPGSPNVPQSMAGREEGGEETTWHTGGLTGSSAISAYDAHIRLSRYADPAQEMARDMLRRVDAGEMGHLSARADAVEGRNALLRDTRSRLSPGGRAFSEALKEEGRSMDYLVDRYTRRVVQADPELLARYGLESVVEGSDDWERGMARAMRDLGETPDVSREILRASGRTSRAVTGVARVSRALGPIGTAAGLGVSAYEIVNAPEGERLHAIARETGGFAGGTLGAIGGGLAGAWVASLACGPGAPVCALVVSVIFVGGGGYFGGLAGEEGGSLVYRGLQSLPMAMPVHALAAGGGYSGLMARDRARFQRMIEPLDVRAARRLERLEREIAVLDARIPMAESQEDLEALQRIRLEKLVWREELMTVIEAFRRQRERR